MLLNTSQLSNPSRAPEKSGAFAVGGENTAGSLQKADAVSSAVGALRDGQTAHFVSRGQWSMHELLEMMLRKAGPSDVFMSTWTITEDPARRIFLLKQEGMIKSLSCVLDYRIKDRKPQPFQLLENTADRIVLTQCHAKATVVVGEHMSLTCLSSANYSKNPRIEAGIICRGREVAEFHKEWIEQAINEGSSGKGNNGNESGEAEGA